MKLFAVITIVVTVTVASVVTVDSLPALERRLEFGCGYIH
jgi:hypothetical protein